MIRPAHHGVEVWLCVEPVDFRKQITGLATLVQDHHGGIAMLTPDDVHHGRAQRILEKRQRTLRAAWSQHPERFVHGAPKPQPLPTEVWINPPTAATTPHNAQ